MQARPACTLARYPNRCGAAYEDQFRLLQHAVDRVYCVGFWESGGGETPRCQKCNRLWPKSQERVLAMFSSSNRAVVALALRQLSDERIMAEVQTSNGDAFAVLFDRYHRLVLVTALKILRDLAEAEEVTQSVFLEIYQKARQYDAARGTFKGWLLQVAYHRSINRRNYLVLRHFYDQANMDEAAVREGAAAARLTFIEQEVTQLANEVLATLSGAQQRTIRMVFFEGMTLKEVAEQTNESFSNVRNHYYRGLDRLRISLFEEPRKLRHNAL